MVNENEIRYLGGSIKVNYIDEEKLELKRYAQINVRAITDYIGMNVEASIKNLSTLANLANPPIQNRLLNTLLHKLNMTEQAINN